MSANLVFSQHLATPNLVFGETDTPTGPSAVSGDLVLSFPALELSAQVQTVTTGTLNLALPGMTMAADAAYRTNTQRPVTRTTNDSWQQAERTEQGADSKHQNSARSVSGSASAWQEAEKVQNGNTISRTGNLQHLRTQTAQRMWSSRRLPERYYRAEYQDGGRVSRTSSRAGYENAARLPAVRAEARHEDALRTSRNRTDSCFQGARTGGRAATESLPKNATRLPSVLLSLFQDAEPAHAGKWTRPVTPPPAPRIHSADLLFAARWTGSADLLFYNDYSEPEVPAGLVTIPVRRAYIVINNVHIRRVDGNIELPCYSLSLSLDRSSWTWGFSASLHASAESLVEPANYGEPVELEVEVAGRYYRLLAEGITRERAFANNRISITGRGRSAVLSRQNAVVQSFMNTEMRSAQQIMSDILTDNGVPMGWDIDFGLDDWNIPAGVFSHNGTYVSAINAVAAAAGGYVHADPVLDKLFVRHAYPTAPWEWGTVTPDIELPASVVSRESLVWEDRPNYNGVYVSGTTTGVIARVLRAGTAGDLLAPMITDPLITSEIAARQRGLSILGDTGRVATVSLNMPVLPETGIITPGKMIRYVDGGVSRIGISRSVQFSFTNPTARQTIEVETHV